jgi:hypothetical protein
MPYLCYCTTRAKSWYDPSELTVRTTRMHITHRWKIDTIWYAPTRSTIRPNAQYDMPQHEVWYDTTRLYNIGAYAPTWSTICPTRSTTQLYNTLRPSLRHAITRSDMIRSDMIGTSLRNGTILQYDPSNFRVWPMRFSWYDPRFVRYCISAGCNQIVLWISNLQPITPQTRFDTDRYLLVELAVLAIPT